MNSLTLRIAMLFWGKSSSGWGDGKNSVAPGAGALSICPAAWYGTRMPPAARHPAHLETYVPEKNMSLMDTHKCHTLLNCSTCLPRLIAIQRIGKSSMVQIPNASKCFKYVWILAQDPISGVNMVNHFEPYTAIPSWPPQPKKTAPTCHSRAPQWIGDGLRPGCEGHEGQIMLWQPWKDGIV